MQRSWLQLISIVSRNIADDLKNNILNRPPILLILNPDSFEPPFTNGFDEYFNVTSTALLGQYSNSKAANYAIVALSIVLAGLDIIYSIIRLSISTMLMGAFLGSLLFFGLWFVVTASRRWKLVVLLFQNNDYNVLY
ncbi:hypothetical protein MEM_02762 [Candida albicans L26]|uniref:Uncharacterized protein n=3 Tax=Candida albicans TaxID=5476 RepID=Q5AEV7_CANAL|nr:uncharacterized protein CAALFM_C302890CA [Candida albicans SC5314]XP_719992.1 uncharacterized protein CAALFM_C303000WA [Candida albicans SC5314]EEQ44344.1 conserved hypothetical protein [Candida albicans WO-1]KGQ87914.1 hypothetical protein MEO_02715 [Candida albicans P94015]KGQ92216.1 hypothetical protein MEU_02739 [Candida albicans P37005]KGQ99597.1 hypothetical protein MG1_02762 [Candida albicans GC75]KGR12675.1 hypothetical protein MG3_02759 [Candida albicans P78048]KGR17404.1 hypothe|eukprot:XP_719978.1 hypothetical protein CAALFM_C302890CA [Candida albicans SC5314]